MRLGVLGFIATPDFLRHALYSGSLSIINSQRVLHGFFGLQTLLAESEKFEGVVKNLELVFLVKLFFEIAHGTFAQRNRGAALQARQMVFVLVGRTVEGFAAGEGSHLY